MNIKNLMFKTLKKLKRKMKIDYLMKMKIDYLNMVSKIYEVDLKAAREKNQKKLYDVLKSAINIKPKKCKN